MCSATKEKLNFKGNYIVDCFNKRLLLLNVFSSQKLNIRKTMLAKSSVLTDEAKKKWKPALIPELMSSEESDDSDEGNASFTVHPILWRSDKVTNFLYRLDQKKSNNSTQRSRRMSLKQKVGLPSDRLPPASLLDWMVKRNQ